MRRDIDEALSGWPQDSGPGELVARQVQARDGRTIIQIRVELGILQMDVEGRPDGSKPHGFSTYLDYLKNRSAAKPRRSAGWKMSAEQGAEADREFTQFYHRRVAWLILQRFDNAFRDAEHSIALMDFVRDHGPTDEYVDSHERFRGLVLFDRTQAAVALAISRDEADAAIDAIREGIAAIEAHEEDWASQPDREDSPNAGLIAQLQSREDDIRQSFDVEKTLREQLDEAVADEDYEKAARLRDQIRARAEL